MSTAILHAGSFIHDFNDIVMKVRWSQKYFRFKNFIVQKAERLDEEKVWRQEFEKHMFCFHNVF